mgnify:CR=1 FL=1
MGDLTTLVGASAVSYTHLRAHETVLDLVCRLLLEKTDITPYTMTVIRAVATSESHKHF